jgi:hypothetical protein
MQKALRKAYAQMQDADVLPTRGDECRGDLTIGFHPGRGVPSMDKTEVMDFDANPLLSQPTEISGARTSSQFDNKYRRRDRSRRPRWQRKRDGPVGTASGPSRPRCS